jgi:hypothetical protein
VPIYRQAAEISALFGSSDAQRFHSALLGSSNAQRFHSVAAAKPLSMLFSKDHHQLSMVLVHRFGSSTFPYEEDKRNSYLLHFIFPIMPATSRRRKGFCESGELGSENYLTIANSSF